MVNLGIAGQSVGCVFIASKYSKNFSIILKIVSFKIVPAVIFAPAAMLSISGFQTAGLRRNNLLPIRPALYEKKKSDFQSQTFKLDFCNPTLKKAHPIRKKSDFLDFFQISNLTWLSCST